MSDKEEIKELKDQHKKDLENLNVNPNGKQPLDDRFPTDI